MSIRFNKSVASIAITLTSLCLAYAPIPGLNKTVVIVSGTELQAPLQELANKFQ
jgi:hypothetical protein